MEDRLKALEIENTSLKNTMNTIKWYMKSTICADLHLDSSFYKQSMDINNYFTIKKWHDSSIGQSTVIQQLDKNRPKLLNLNQTQNRRKVC